MTSDFSTHDKATEVMATAVPREDHADMPPPEYSFIDGDRDTDNASIEATDSEFSHNNLQDDSGTVAVNGLDISTRRDPIVGTFSLDPSIPLEGKPCTRACGKSCKHRTMPPCALFQSRHGAISVGFTVDSSAPAPQKARIIASTRRGDVSLSMTRKSPGQAVDLDVYTRHGNALLLLPPTFAGFVDVRASRANIETLPGITHAVRFVSSSKRDVRLLIGAGLDGELPPHADYAKIYCRHGHLSLGSSITDNGGKA